MTNDAGDRDLEADLEAADAVAAGLEMAVEAVVESVVPKDVIEDIVEDAVAEAVANGIITEEAAAALTDKIVDEVVEEIVEEIVEEAEVAVRAEAAEEIVAEVIAEEIAEEEIAAEALAEEIVEEVVAADLAEAELIDIVEAAAPAPAPQPESPYDRPGGWYVVHSYAGYENKVKSNLETRVRSMNAEDRIYECVIPMEDVIEFKGGRKTVVKKKVFPGYILVRMALDDASWTVVRNTPGVTGFVGGGARPTPLSRKEVEGILGVEVPEGVAPVEKKVRPRLEFDLGEQVRVVTGPFADFNGAISEIDVDRSKLKVLVNIFGRETPVELEFGQVAKL
jgi:transcriptional antiterminator NusG